jgi:hypothetical protein
MLPKYSRHTMRLALLVVSCCTAVVAGVGNAQDATLPAESSFIFALADEAIVADGTAAICNRELARSDFARAFLQGYSTPGSTIPVNATLCSSRMNGRGWNAGQAYRRAHPDSVAQVMREYGYNEFEGAGTWTVGFEAGGFQPDPVTQASSPNSPQTCWYLAIIHGTDLDAQLEQIVPSGARLRGGTLRVNVRGFLSRPGRFGHLGVCERQLYAVSVTTNGG